MNTPCVILPWLRILLLPTVESMETDNTENVRRKEHKDPLLEAVGKRIRQVRENKGYAQEEFAYRAGIDRSYYGAVERGRYSVTTVNLVRIALALEVEVGDLFPARSELAGLIPQDQE